MAVKKLSKSDLRKRRKTIKQTRRLIAAALETDNPIRESLLGELGTEKEECLSWEVSRNFFKSKKAHRALEFHRWNYCSYGGDWDSYKIDVKGRIDHHEYMANYPEPSYIDEDNWDHYCNFCKEERIDHLKWLESYPKKHKIPKHIKKALYRIEKAELYYGKW